MNIPSALLSIFLFFYSVLLFATLTFRGSYILENVLSLLPYILVINILIIAALFLILSFKLLLSPLALSVLILTIMLSIRLVNFSFMPSAHASSGKQDIKIAFLNKLYSNTNYAPIDEKVKKLNPDILAFAEMKNKDPENIRELSNYSYQLNIQVRDDAGLYLFSKYPAIKNTEAPVIPFILPITLTIEEKPIYVFLVHPFPPATNSWVRDRDESLEKLAEYINTLPEDQVLLLGDFNLSPWSNSYQSLVNKLPNLYNAASGKGFKFSWHGGILRTQIDHIFIPKNGSVESFNTFPIDGSDHNLLSTVIKI